MSKTTKEQVTVQLCRNALIMSVTSTLLRLITHRARLEEFSLESLAKISGVPLKRLEAIFLHGHHDTLTLNEISDIALAFNCEISFSIMNGSDW